MWHQSERTSRRGTAPDRPHPTGTAVQAACDAAFGESPLATAVTEGERHVLRYLNAAWLEFAGAEGDPGLGRPFGECFPELAEQILEFSRTEAGEIEVRREPVDAAALARDAAMLVEPLVQQKGLSFTLHVSDDPMELETDPRLLKQILINLLTNAVKFTDAGEIRLILEGDAKDLLCAVQDTGIGIPQDQLQHIFEPFQQVDADGKRPTEGTGLGLTVSQRLARMLGGDLTVQSKPGEGSRFTVHCPLRPRSRRS